MAAIPERLEAYRNLFRLDGKTALVLGAASGIGKASAEALAALGASVICADKNADGVELTAAEIGAHANAEAHVVDAGEAEAVNALAAAIAAKHKRLDVAVTTPAVHVRKLMLDYTDEEYDRVVARTDELAIRLPPFCRDIMRPKARRNRNVPRKLRSTTRSYSSSV